MVKSSHQRAGAGGWGWHQDNGEGGLAEGTDDIDGDKKNESEDVRATDAA